MNKAPYSIRIAHWPQDRSLLKMIRETVFVQEQKVPLELEWDDKDTEAVHLLAEDGNQQPIGTARLLPSGQIGRMAVLKSWRNRGVGQALLRRLIEIAESRHYPTPFLNAQLTAVRFYQQQGFAAAGKAFLDAGIPHKTMRWKSPDG